MTSYATIPDTDVDQDSPVSVALMTGLRDNPIAITEGASGAPRIKTAALFAPASGSTTIAVLIGNSAVNNATSGYLDANFSNHYDQARHIGFTVLVAGVVTCAWDQRCNSPGTASVRILKNGSVVNTILDSNPSFVAKTQDVTVAVGDKIVFQNTFSGGAISIDWRNIEIRSATADMAVA